jgi:hypothetical protein
MKKLLLLLLILLPYRGVADMVSSGNVIPQQFFQNNQEHNEWTCTDPTHNHGNNIGAMVNGDHLMHPGVSLANDVNMTEAQIQNGWSSELGADIWHWNTSTSTTTMTQTITDSAGNVTTQTRDVVLGSCGRTNCGSYNTYTDTHVQGANTATDFQIAVRFDFAESTNRTSHWAVDIKNPTLNISYEENPVPQISQDTLTQLENVDTQIEDAIDMLENEEIGGTTFTEMIEDIIVDSGLDMTLTMGFVEPEMDLEEQFYMDETVEIDTLEQNIEDEMAGVMILAPTDMDFDEPTMDMDMPDMDIEMPVMIDMDMPDMETPSFTEMTVEAFEDMSSAFADMFNMDMPEDLSTEAVTEIMDAMVDMDMPIEMPEGAPMIEEVYEAPDTMVSEGPIMEETPVMEDRPVIEESTNVETLEEAPVETVAMAEPEPEMETPQAMEEEVVQEDEPVAMGEEDSMTSSEPTMEENQPTEEVQSSENETVTTETTTETPQEENTSATSEPETDTQSEEVSQEGDTNQETETVSEESSMDENTPSENTPTQEGGEESVVAEADTDTEVSETTTTVSVEVQEIGEKVAKIIAKVNANLKKVSDRVRAAQLIRLKGIQTDGPNLKVYASKSFYPDTGMNGVPNPDFFQDINILEQQQIYADAKLAYRDNDPIAVKQSILIDINNKKNKLYRELRDLKR